MVLVVGATGMVGSEICRLLVDRGERVTALVRPWSDAAKGRTRREILALRRGLTIHRGWGVRQNLTAEQVQVIASTLPPPTFDAGPRLRDLDEMERE